MRSIALLLVACLIGVSTPVWADEPVSRILQLYSYRLVDSPRFRDAYRAHLGWHARHHDPLAWYGWTVQAGPRRGMFIDGTAGATLAGLDARPDLAGDGADFVATVGTAAQPVDVETWVLWSAPSTATPLEVRTPAKVVDVFLLTVPPGDASAFEKQIKRLTRQPRATGSGLTWYRRLRGGADAGYMVILARDRWADIAADKGTLPELLRSTYNLSSPTADLALKPVRALQMETWVYEPSLSLLPGNLLSGG